MVNGILQGASCIGCTAVQKQIEDAFYSQSSLPRTTTEDIIT
jgi:hypothetical protein